MQNHRKLSIFISHPSDLLTDYQPHGDGLVAFGFIRHLAERGHTLHVVVDSADIKGELPGNIKLYPTNIQASSIIVRRLMYILKVRQIFSQVEREHQIDIIHQLNPVVTGLSLALGKPKQPLVLGPIVAFWPKNENQQPRFSISKLIADSAKNFFRTLLSYLQQKQASSLLVVTPAALNRLYRPDSIAHKIRDLRHGIDPNTFLPASNTFSKISETPNILFLGKISYHKGILTLLEAFEIVAMAIPSCQLLIAGTWGSNQDEVKQKISSMACKSQVVLLGKVERRDVPELIHSCTVFCLPSYGEAFGMSALEAMACGKPVVGTDAGGLSYLIDEQGGRKVPPRNAEALAAALLEILRSPDLQAEMGRYNRRLVEEEYSWEQVTGKLESVYYQLLNSSSTP